MLASKNITRIIALAMAVAVVLCVCAVGFSEKIAAAAGSTGVAMEYESILFDTSEVLGVNIVIDETQWADMLQNAIEEEYYQCDVEIAGKTFYRVGIRPKGNTSLSAIVSDPDTDRYSFKLKFNEYVDGQTCFGLDELILNNNYADATNMKEALIYDLFAFAGADASLYNYAKISVNGEYWGIYLALEAVNDSFLLRNYGTQSGSLYKPENEMMGGSGGSVGGADLNYSDDDLDSYSTIWDGEVSKTTASDHKRVVTALKNIFAATDLEEYMDIDNLLRYMAVHVFSVNDDSLSGNMAHNYYLYESKGKLNLIPWDYNLSFGGMGRNADAASVVNSAIDDAFSGTNFFDTLMEAEECHERYYSLLEKISTEYIDGGGFDAFYSRVRSQIDSLVESDPTAFYSYEEYQAAADTLYQIVKLRGQSIQGQLEGAIPSTDRAQSGSDALIDASGLSVSAMGTMNAGGGQMPGNMDRKSPQDMQLPQGTENMQFMGRIGDENFPELPSGLEDDNFPTLPDGTAVPAFHQDADTGGQVAEQPDGEAQPTDNFRFGGGRDFERQDRAGFPSGEVRSSADSARADNLIWYGVSLAVLLAALLFAVLFRRRIK